MIRKILCLLGHHDNWAFWSGRTVFHGHSMWKFYEQCQKCGKITNVERFRDGSQ